MSRRSAAWDDPAWRDALEDAGWRYATLIGVTDPDEAAVPSAVREADRARYPHRSRRDGHGRPIWDVAEAETFVHEITGASGFGSELYTVTALQRLVSVWVVNPRLAR